MFAKDRFSLCILLCFLLLVGPCGLAGLHAQGDDAPLPMMSLDVWLDQSGGVIVGVRSEAQPEQASLPRKPFEEALGGTIEPIKAEDKSLDPVGWQLLGRCDGMFPLHGGLRQGRIDLKPLLPLLHSQKIRWVSLSIMQSPQPYSHSTGIRRYSPQAAHRVYYSRTVDLTKPGEVQTPITLTYGYAPRDVADIVLPLLVILIVPFGLTLWMRSQALGAEERATASGRALDPAVVWFGYGRYLYALSTGIWIVWFPAVVALHASAFVRFLIGHSWAAHSGLPLLLIYLPALVIIGCSDLSHPVFDRIGGQGYTRREMLAQAAWGQSRLLPLLCMLNGVTEFFSDPRVGVAWFGGAFLLNSLVTRGAAGALGVLPQSLVVGELRDRVFALAHSAGVPVRQVFLMPAGKGRMANAFASLGSTLMLTEFLLRRLNKREVDAVIGHELTHLKRRHPQALQAAHLALIAAAAAVTVYTETQTTFSALAGFAYALITLLGLILVYGLSRRFEWQADAGAIALTGDGEALITGLAKISALNRTPLQWGKWQEKWLSHPPTLRRMERIGLAASLPPERVTLLARPETLEAPEAASETPEEYYRIPALEPDTQIFGIRRKSRLQQSLYWTDLLLPPLVAALAVLLGSWWAAGMGLVLALLVPSLAANAIQQRWYGGLEEALREKLRGALSPGPAEFVTYSPYPMPRLYDGFYDWDPGFLQLSDGCLRFVGEKTRFALTPAQILSVEPNEDTPGLWRRWSRLTVRWQDTACQPPTIHAFSLRPGASGSVWQSRSAADNTKKQLETWRAAALLTPPGDSRAPLPLRREVSALSPRQAVTGRALMQLLLPRLGFAAGTGILFGLTFRLDLLQWRDVSDAGGWYVLLVAFLVFLSGIVPLWRCTDPPAPTQP